MYLGYIGVGIIKLCKFFIFLKIFLKGTFGLFGVLYVYDVLFISLQILKPSDGTAFVFGYQGPQVHRFGNQTSLSIY
jgi:hypothetical protein